MHPTSQRSTTSLNVGWVYHRGAVSGQPQSPDFATGTWESVHLPHTYQLTSINLDDCDDDQSQETYHRDVCWYRKTVPIEAEPGQRVYLEFEGAKQRTELWVNGQFVGEHAISGYTPFHFDITDHVVRGADNTIALKLDNRKTDEIPPDGHTWDYVLFGGLTRDVRLVVTDPLHITFPWEAREAGVFITTPSVSRENATVTVRTTVRNSGSEARQAKVVTRVIDAEDVVVMKLVESLGIPPGTDRTAVQTGGIDENVRLWSFDDPYLYRVNTQVVEDDAVIDMVENPLGLRWFELRPDVGFCLNGEPYQLVGSNRHQHYPYIGDAVPDNLHWADAIKFKQSGMNLVRLAHYPHDDAFLDACDALGILVCEEPPTWIEFGPPIWMDRLEESLRRTIRNHRNHPSVWGWGAGINHRGPVKRLHYASKQEDPDRLTMNNGTVWTGPQNRGITDLYAVMDYQDVTRPEGAFLFAMEHSGSDEHGDATDTIGMQEIVSKYKGDPWLIGLTAWAAHDSYSFKKRGEENPNLSEWTAAAWDAFRIRKPLFYWYQSEMAREPMVHIPDARAQHEGATAVLANCDEVELFVNGESVGIRGPEQRDSTRHINSPSFHFPVDWRSGDLVAEGRIDGKVVASHTRRRPGAAHHIEVSFDPDAGPFVANGSSIYPATARICDANGTIIEEPTPEVTFELEGSGEIVGDASIGANPVTWKLGIAPVLVRAGTESGKMVLTARADGLESGSATLETAPWTPDLNANQGPIRELLRLRVDLGGPGQHIEDEWTGWSLDGEVSDPEVFDADGRRVRATISASKGDLDATSTWGVPGDLSYLIEDGVQVTAEEGIDLRLSELPAGGYVLKTWHHVLGGREDTSPLQLTADDADGNGRVLHEVFHPTFGRQIEVSSAGTGGAGDGGSNRGAAGFAESSVRVDDTGTFTVRIRATETKGVIVLNGFDLRAIPPASD